nr:hypothetical protein [Corynebacterium accolens]
MKYSMRAGRDSAMASAAASAVALAALVTASIAAGEPNTDGALVQRPVGDYGSSE